MKKLIPNQSTIYRLLIEQSTMLNNNIQVVYIPSNQLEEFKAGLKPKAWNPNQVVLKRPVHEEEVVARLNITYKGLEHEEKSPIITKQLDSIYRLKGYFDFHKKLSSEHDGLPADIADLISYYIASHYYDCMSAGANKWDLVILKTILTAPQLTFDLNKEIYPRNDGSHHTLYDFLREVGKLETIELKTMPLLLEMVNGNTT